MRNTTKKIATNLLPNDVLMMDEIETFEIALVMPYGRMGIEVQDLSGGRKAVFHKDDIIEVIAGNFVRVEIEENLNADTDLADYMHEMGYSLD